MNFEDFDKNLLLYDELEISKKNGNYERMVVYKTSNFNDETVVKKEEGFCEMKRLITKN